jgi:hypothetical protein
LDEQERITGSIIDWGCGKGADVTYLQCQGYDPHYRPERPLGAFDTVLCTYVLNTIPNYHDRCVIITEALAYLKRGGWIYVAIRPQHEIEKVGEGYRPNSGTWQGYVGDQLQAGGFEYITGPLIARGVSGFEIWGWQMP